VSQINMAIGQISQAVQMNAASSEELASTSEEMNAQALELQSLMAVFTQAGAPDQWRAPAQPARTSRPPLAKAPASRGPKLKEGEFTQF
jgi:hypothetical protein